MQVSGRNHITRGRHQSFGTWCNEVARAFEPLTWVRAKFVKDTCSLSGMGHTEYACDEVLQSNAVVVHRRVSSKWDVITLVSGDGNDNRTFEDQKTKDKSHQMAVSSLWTTAQHLVLEQGCRLEVVSWQASTSNRYKQFEKELPCVVKIGYLDEWPGRRDRSMD